MPTVLLSEATYDDLTKLLSETQDKTGERSLKRPALIEKMIQVYRKQLG